MSPGFFSDVLFINFTNTGQFTDEKQPVIQEWKASWGVDIHRSQGKVKVYMFQWAVLDLHWAPFQLLNLAFKL